MKSSLAIRGCLSWMAACACLIASPAMAQWGNLSGTFVYDGEAPVRAPVAITQDAEVCGPPGITNESLIVHPENRGIANVVVYLYLRSSDTPPVAHPSYEEAAQQPVLISNDDCIFDPHIAVARAGQTLHLHNADSVPHNMMASMFSQDGINILLRPNETQEHVFAASERMPATISCSIHPWMTGRLIVKDHPYIAVTDENGYFTMPNLPVGDWTFQVWHEKAGYVENVTLDGTETEWARGRFDITIGEGDHDQGQIVVAPANFE